LTTNKPQLPRWIVYTLAIAVVLSWLPFSLISRARAIRGGDTKVHLIQDMANQPRCNPQAPATFFLDARAMRPNVSGTVARGQLWDEEHLYRGKLNGNWAYYGPVPISEVFVRRGQERFNVYCSTCHGLVGIGDGPTHQRAVKLVEPKWVPPTSLASQQVREQADGSIFNTITNGIRNMPAHGPQIPAEDRWAIVSYVRALQLSRDANANDLPPEKRDRLR
jgi:mono/diheme cytochrome c family protein